MRAIRFSTLLLLAAFALLVFLTHLPYFGLPYFWDELGQFVPAALDILRDGAWIPHSTVPNAHPPGVMAYLALVWRIAGYSIPATRLSMLVLAAATVICTFFLAGELSRDRIPAILAVGLLAADPLFYTQSMLAQLDMPAMLFTVLGLLLFLSDRHAAAAAACTALVLAKETGALLPLIFLVVLYRDPARSRYAAYYLAPFAALAIWFFALWHSTGYLFGDPGFTHYNTTYSLNPVRASVALLRRFYYLFIDDFRWVGSIAIFFAWKQARLYSTRAWKITWGFIAAHILLVSLLGGATLERYLLPVLPLVYIAMGAAFQLVRPRWRYPRRSGSGRRARGRPFPQSALPVSLRKQSRARRLCPSPPRRRSIPRKIVSRRNYLHCLAAHPSSAQSGVRLRRPRPVRGRNLRPALFHAPEAESKIGRCPGALLAHLGAILGSAAMAGSARFPKPLLRIRTRNDSH